MSRLRQKQDLQIRSLIFFSSEIVSAYLGISGIVKNALVSHFGLLSTPCQISSSVTLFPCKSFSHGCSSFSQQWMHHLLGTPTVSLPSRQQSKVCMSGFSSRHSFNVSFRVLCSSAIPQRSVNFHEFHCLSRPESAQLRQVMGHKNIALFHHIRETWKNEYTDTAVNYFILGYRLFMILWVPIFISVPILKDTSILEYRSYIKYILLKKIKLFWRVC